MKGNILKRVVFYSLILLFLVFDYLSLSQGSLMLDDLKRFGILNLVFPLLFIGVIVVTIFAVKGNVPGFNFTRAALITAIFAMSAVYFTSLREEASKVHFLEYELITLLFFKALEIDIKGRIIYAVTLVAICLFGILEEVTQALFPDRSFDLKDLRIDIFSSIFITALIYFFKEWKRNQSLRNDQSAGQT